MAAFDPDALARLLEGLLPRPRGALCVALSGGEDSRALLRALVTLQGRGLFGSLRATHVDHGIHADSGAWSAHCRVLADALRVPLHVVRVATPTNHVQGLEAAAREVRYLALAEQLQPDETLITAHHADDQLETVLLALMRGAGVRGLAAMPACTAFASGWHARPLLNFPRAALQAWAEAQPPLAAGAALDDPANRDPRFARTLLRHRVLPVLTERWPAAATLATRTAAHLGEAAALLDELASADLITASAGECLTVDALARLSAPRQKNLVRHWLRRRGLPLPDARQLHALLHDLLGARPHRLPMATWPGAEVRRYRGVLYAARPEPSSPDLSRTTYDWNWPRPLTLPPGLGELALVPGDGVGALDPARLPPRIRVGFRAAAGDATGIRGESLRKRLQTLGVLPWWRGRLPLLSDSHGALIAIADLWCAVSSRVHGTTPGLHVEWRRPAATAISPTAISSDAAAIAREGAAR